MRRGLAVSREQARALVDAGQVLVAGAPAVKAGRLVAAAEPLRTLGPPSRFVSRGGEKLDAALDCFAIDVRGLRVLDAGASTGGFTDCLLQRGARSVVALDVGHGQLHPRLRADPRVTVIERANLRYLGSRGGDAPAAGGGDALGGERFAMIVADLSFISLTSVAEPLVARLSQPGATLLVLVKPQFEVGREEASRSRGVIRDPELWAAAVRRVASSLRAQGAAMIGVMASPIAGAGGNVELVLHARAPERPAAAAPADVPGRARGPDALEDALAAAILEVKSRRAAVG